MNKLQEKKFKILKYVCTSKDGLTWNELTQELNELIDIAIGEYENIPEIKEKDRKRILADVMQKIKESNSSKLERFKMPSDKSLVDIAIIFNGGRLQSKILTNMISYGLFILERLYDNGDIKIPSNNENEYIRNKGARVR